MHKMTLNSADITFVVESARFTDGVHVRVTFILEGWDHAITRPTIPELREAVELTHGLPVATKVEQFRETLECMIDTARLLA